MQPVTKENLEKLIAEGKAAGKDVSGLEAELAEGDYYHSPTPRMGETSEVSKVVLISTGPARKEDFEH